MNDAAAELAKLAQAAGGMRTRNHGRYMAELLRWYRHALLLGPVDPVDSLDFMIALWKTPFAKRPDELAALNDVGRWLEGILMEDVKLSAERLAWRIGWLRRLSHPDEDRSPGDVRAGGEHGAAHGRREEPQRGFGARADAIRRRRADAPTKKLSTESKSAQAGTNAAALVRLIDKGNAAAKVPEVLKAVPDAGRRDLARAILTHLQKKWVEARKGQNWAADLLALAAPN